MTIKKQYVDIVAFLEENKNKQVKTILQDIIDMTEAKVQTRTFVKDADGNVLAIYCYYHKQWELTSEVEYGNKKSSSTGLNTMCKLGVRGWTKQQSLLKKLDVDLLAEVIAGELATEDIAEQKETQTKAIKEQCAIDFEHDSEMYTTLEEVNKLV